MLAQTDQVPSLRLSFLSPLSVGYSIQLGALDHPHFMSDTAVAPGFFVSSIILELVGILGDMSLP
ncbi:hypothetical protein PAXRUDRAFT_21557 [Paxillus rubicundulus Ve08.2h10]|uniref:Uncharacterized protein n=1 Tax=Paxillus rubicundulus Ve08.2h10 TaxID=930991 RepID=A0A0D0CBC3_9AGAM|nr:hypothetical protein PAXRUDRAFT_21557 [Paxillus rubicundulus Ve08.2h10]